MSSELQVIVGVKDSMAKAGGKLPPSSPSTAIPVPYSEVKMAMIASFKTPAVGLLLWRVRIPR